MPRFNIDRIRQLFGEINSALHKLDGYADLSEEEMSVRAQRLKLPTKQLRGVLARYALLVESASEGAVLRRTPHERHS